MQKSLIANVDRVINAPLEKVFQTWVNPDTLHHWFGPPGHIVTKARFDFRIEGRYEIKMRSPENNIYTLKGQFLEIVAYEKLVYSWRWDQVELGEYETEVTVKFTKEKSGTRIVIEHKNFSQASHYEGHRVGWLGSLDRIAQYYNQT